MKIQMKKANQKIPFILFVPNQLLTSSFVWESLKEQCPNWISQNLSKDTLKQLQQYVKSFGHFRLVEIHTKDHMDIIITI